MSPLLRVPRAVARPQGYHHFRRRRSYRYYFTALTNNASPSKPVIMSHAVIHSACTYICIAGNGYAAGGRGNPSDTPSIRFNRHPRGVVWDPKGHGNQYYKPRFPQGVHFWTPAASPSLVNDEDSTPRVLSVGSSGIVQDRCVVGVSQIWKGRYVTML